MEPFASSIQWIRQAVEEKQIPSAALAIGDRNRLYVKEVFGTTSYTEDAAPADEHTLYDMASVTKILSTTMITLRYIAAGKLDLADMLPLHFGDLVPEDKQGISIFHLLTHTSGFPAHIMLEDYMKPGDDAAEFLLRQPLEYQPGTKEIYSCMGFILLGKLLERISGKTLDVLAQEEVFGPLGMTRTGYHPVDRPIDPSNTAFTERDHKTGAWLCGRVHDENARFLNGVSGNAGVFSDLEDCIRFARMLTGHGTLDGETYLPRRIFDTAIRNYTPGMDENRGLGFHLANGYYSYSGQFFDQTGFGHNGFTGPHIFVSPDSGLYVVLLNNRVHPTRANAAHLRLRRILHTLAAVEYDELRG